MNKNIVRQIAPEIVIRFEEKKCTYCIKDMINRTFKDELSKKEFGISGLCQECQDKTFGKCRKNCEHDPKRK